MKIGIELIVLTYIHNSTSYTKEHKHRPKITYQEMENFLFGCGKLNVNNNRWYRPILLRSVEQEPEVGGGDGSRFNWSTRNHRGNHHQFKPRGFVQNKRFKPAEQEAKTGPDASVQETGKKQNEPERQTEGIQNIPQYVMEEPAREEIEWLES